MKPKKALWLARKTEWAEWIVGQQDKDNLSDEELEKEYEEYFEYKYTIKNIDLDKTLIVERTPESIKEFCLKYGEDYAIRWDQIAEEYGAVLLPCCQPFYYHAYYSYKSISGTVDDIPGSLLFYALAIVGKNYLLMSTAIFFESFCGGMATVAFVAFLMGLCDTRFTATQFAALSALAAVGRVFVGPIAGVMVEHIGWAHFYFWAFFTAFPGLVLLMWLRKKVNFEGL